MAQLKQAVVYVVVVVVGCRLLSFIIEQWQCKYAQSPKAKPLVQRIEFGSSQAEVTVVVVIIVIVGKPYRIIMSIFLIV